MKSTNRVRLWLATLAVAAVFSKLPPLASADTVVSVHVPGWSDPWLAGMPDGSRASCSAPPDGGCDYAPQQSPQLVGGLPLIAGRDLTFIASGGVAHHPGYPLYPPDGGIAIASHDAGAQNGISGLTAPFDCLVGVFLDGEAPASSPAPGPLNISDYVTLLPVLKQVFYIGDGRQLFLPDEVQHVIVPAGATRLFLGTMDRSGWYNNVGAFDVLVTASTPVAVAPSPWGRVKAGYR